VGKQELLEKGRSITRPENEEKMSVAFGSDPEIEKCGPPARRS